MTEVKGRDPQTGDGIRVVLDGERIYAVEPCAIDSDLWLAPGLVDLQVNGFGGHDLNTDDLSVDTVVALTHAMLRTGVTSFAPTLITGSRKRLLHALRVIAEARRSYPLVAACIPIVHMEGPSISPSDGYRGAHPLEHVRPPSLDEFAEWQEASSNLVGLVTMSPHWENSAEYIAAVAGQGVVISLGHTHASPQQIHKAVEAGAKLSTHLGNGIPAIVERHPNPIWSQLAEDRLHASFIADTHHLSTEVLRVMLRAKTLKRSILVSDAVALAGMLPGRYMQPVGGEVELSVDGRLSMAGSTMLAGAAIPLMECMGRCMQMTGLSLAETLRMATLNPATLIGLSADLSLGSKTSLVQFQCNEIRQTLSPYAVWVKGERLSCMS